MKQIAQKLFVLYLRLRVWLAIAYVYLAPAIYFFTHKTISLAPGLKLIVDRRLSKKDIARELAKLTPEELKAKIGHTIRLDRI